MNKKVYLSLPGIILFLLMVCNFGYTGSEKNYDSFASNLFFDEDEKSSIPLSNDLNYRLDKELVHKEPEECIDITGDWTGIVFESGYEITLKLRQKGCSVSGKLQSLGSCPGKCGKPNFALQGTVNGNNFIFTIPKDTYVNCKNCKTICLGTDYGDLLVNGNKMDGTIDVEDCEFGGYFKVTVSLTLVGSGRISGNVIDTERNPVKSAKVSLNGRKKKRVKKTTSDDNGLFEFTDLKVDTYTIKAQKKGYKKSEQTRVLHEGGYIDIEIELEKK
ncbi:MAG: hypothetical protein QG610_1319 [Euryarchaeota archaeon]|nr:hypothetical protein [Euryarchaeota archaeon]